LPAERARLAHQVVLGLRHPDFQLSTRCGFCLSRNQFHACHPAAALSIALVIRMPSSERRFVQDACVRQPTPTRMCSARFDSGCIQRQATGSGLVLIRGISRNSSQPGRRDCRPNDAVLCKRRTADKIPGEEPAQFGGECHAHTRTIRPQCAARRECQWTFSCSKPAAIALCRSDGRFGEGTDYPTDRRRA
jgi:hypothetical protein